MPISLSDIFPNLSATLDGTGFVFGSGSSFEAGYPMMAGLTKQVVGALSAPDKGLLDTALGHVGVTYDPATSTPNIEQIVDIVTAHHIATSDAALGALESRLRELIVESILSVATPNLEKHVRFFEKLKARAFGNSRCIWIFTTNYDSLFEEAATLAGVSLETGFIGTTTRFFHPVNLKCSTGIASGGRFAPNASLTVKLVKLHGSISWFEEGGRFFETHPRAVTVGARRILVLPRRKKVMDTLVPPYDSLFTVSAQTLGGECRYIASCGFSFSDDHILENLFNPPMQAKKCRLFVFSEKEPEGISEFNSLPNFSGGYATHSHKNGVRVNESTDLWKFSRFIEIL